MASLTRIHWQCRGRIRNAVVLVHYQKPHKLAVELKVDMLITVLVLAGLGFDEECIFIQGKKDTMRDVGIRRSDLISA